MSQSTQVAARPSALQSAAPTAQQAVLQSSSSWTNAACGPSGTRASALGSTARKPSLLPCRVRIGSLIAPAEPQPFDLDFNTPVWLFFWTLKVERQKTRSADGSGVAVDDEAAAAMSCARSAAIARRKCVVPGTYDRGSPAVQAYLNRGCLFWSCSKRTPRRPSRHDETWAYPFYRAPRRRARALLS